MMLSMGIGELIVQIGKCYGQIDGQVVELIHQKYAHPLNNIVVN
jgi:hypothetical protein